MEKEENEEKEEDKEDGRSKKKEKEEEEEEEKRGKSFLGEVCEQQRRRHSLCAYYNYAVLVLLYTICNKHEDIVCTHQG